MFDALEHELMRADRYEERYADKQMEQQAERPLAVAVGEVKVAYEVKEPKDDKPARSEKAEKPEGHRERKSVKAQIAEKKDIIAKKAAEKTSPAKNHQAEL